MYPSSILDLMAICWSRDPDERPSANEIESFASRPEFCSLLNVVAVEDHLTVMCACSVLQDKRRSSIHGQFTIHSGNTQQRLQLITNLCSHCLQNLCVHRYTLAHQCQICCALCVFNRHRNILFFRRQLYGSTK